MKKKIKFTEKTIKRIFIVLGILFLVIMIDSIKFKTDIEKAEDYYSNKEFYEVEKIIDKYPLHFNNEFVKKYKFAQYLLTEYNMLIRNSYYDDTEHNLKHLLYGYNKCLETKSKNDWEEKIIDEVKSYYYVSINELVDLSEEEIKEICNFDTKQLEEKISELVKKIKLNNYKNKNPLKVSITSCNSSSASGTIYNQGSNTIKYAKIKISFKDKYNNTIDTDWTYAIGSEGLSPNESKQWKVYIDKNSSIHSCSYTILDYD